jgi:hypothetical protein
VAQIEQAEQRLEILAGDGYRLVGGSDGVVETDPAVPDRVPDRVGQLADVAPDGAGLVQEHQVEVGVGSRLAPSEPADRDQRDAGRFFRRLARVGSRRGERAQQRRQPRVIGVGQRRSQGQADKSGLAEDAGPDLIE